ncbi:NUDIX hydrolase [Streptomyces beihaiensis]|uniref:NUDIX hydrolase n=1 Tax=Streptomyces beihaiensis TaxID=2984495 RepID=A0ABT3TYQ7_9ACTN|nr:NUDIX hydrolase [Streptomyces beihaiensis]MCX3062171.1 NUDIX hydrolase [Streptomyces beihaiensis]
MTAHHGTGPDPHAAARGPLVRAAGCVLWRHCPLSGGTVEICLVHRPKYDDWSHPKGKLKRGEAPRDAALREVLEETGAACELGAPLPTARYLDARHRPKEVHYWAAEATSGAFVPSHEVDRIRWLPPDAARARLTQPRDRDLVDALLDALRAA